MATTRESKSTMNLQLPMYPEEGGYTLEVWHQLAEKACLHFNQINSKHIREQLHVLGKVIKAVQEGKPTQEEMMQFASEAIRKNGRGVLNFLIQEKLIDVNGVVTDYAGNKASILHCLGGDVRWVLELLKEYAFTDEVLNLKVKYHNAPQVICSSSCSKEEWDRFMGDAPPLPSLPAPTTLLEMLLATSTDYFMSFFSMFKLLFAKGDINLAGAIYYAYIAIQNNNVLLNVLDIFKAQLEKTKFDIPAAEKTFLEELRAAEHVEKKADAVTLLEKTMPERYDFYHLQLAKQAYAAANKDEILQLATAAVRYGYQQTFEFISKLKDHDGQFSLDINKKFRGGRYGEDVTFPVLAAENQRWDILTTILNHSVITSDTINYHTSKYEPTILERLIDHYAVISTVEEKDHHKKGKTQVTINEKLKEPIKCFLKAGGIPIDRERYLISEYLYKKFYSEHWQSGECTSWVENGRTRYHTPAWIVVNDHRKHPQIKELYKMIAPYLRQYSCHVRACNKVTQAAKYLAGSVCGLFGRKPAVYDETKPKLESKRP